ncbi:MAG TPA: heme o synthase [Alphaproteobacteria bacterium]|nr:heme o synthase [Alphaproteobacteria bacterium]
MTQTLRNIACLFKLRIGMAITLSALAGLAVSPGPAPSAWKVAVLALAVMLSSASAGALNQYFERDLDARMKRTRDRPFVTGAFQASPLWLTAIVLILAGAVAAAAFATNLAAAFHVFMGAFIYGVVYTVWLKRRTWWNIVVGGLAGSFAVLAGASAVDPGLAPAPLILAAVLFLWTPPHFWSLAAALHEEYAEAGVPMLPVVVGLEKASWIILAHTLVLVALSIAPVFFGLGWIYGAGAAIGGFLFIRASIAYVRQPTRKRAMANFKASLIQLGLLQLAAIADHLVAV